MKSDWKWMWNLSQITEIDQKYLSMSGRLRTGNFQGVGNSKTSNMCGIPPWCYYYVNFWAPEGSIAHEVVQKAASPTKSSTRKVPNVTS